MNTAPPPDNKSANKSDSKLHILLLDPFFQGPDLPGATRSYDLAQRCAAAGHRVSAITTSVLWKGESPLNPGVHMDVMPAHTRGRFGYTRPQHISAMFTRGLLWRIWQSRDVDAVFMGDRPLGTLALASLFCVWRGIPLIVEAREGLPPLPDRTAGFVKNLTMRGARALYRLGGAVARHIIVLSERARDVFQREGLDTSKILLSSPAADTTLFAAQPGRSVPALTAYPQLAQGPLVVYAGRLKGDRNMNGVIALTEAVHRIAPEITFAFCGDGDLRGKFEARAQELGILHKSVWFLDALPRRDLAGLLNAAAAVLAIGKENEPEQPPGVLFDALAAGKPVVLFDAELQRDLIEGRGAGIGLPMDPEAAAAELADFLRDSDGLRRASQQSASLAASKFSLERVIGRVRTLIEEAVAADPRAAVLRRRTLSVKRVMDVAIAGTALLVLSPLLLGLAIAIRFKMGGPVLFTQMRPGLKSKLFKIYKFRSMTSARDASGALLPDAVRLTPFGQALRRYSLDELPQLINVLKGDMSIVGPRPLLPEYGPYYTPEQARRHDVKPGITGWAVVNGRNALTWEEKFMLDVFYVDNLSIGFDIRILFKTVWIILTGHGVSSDGHATFERFDEIMARRQGAEDV